MMRRYLSKDMRFLPLRDYFQIPTVELIEYITMILSKLPKSQLARIAYDLTKSKLPRLKTIKRKALPYNGRIDKRRKTKRKFSRKQLAAQRLFAKRARAGTLRRR